MRISKVRKTTQTMKLLAFISSKYLAHCSYAMENDCYNSTHVGGFPLACAVITAYCVCSCDHSSPIERDHNS